MRRTVLPRKRRRRERTQYLSPEALCKKKIENNARVLNFENFHTREGNIPWHVCKMVKCEKCDKKFKNRLDLMKHEYLYSVWKNN